MRYLGEVADSDSFKRQSTEFASRKGVKNEPKLSPVLINSARTESAKTILRADL